MAKKNSDLAVVKEIQTVLDKYKKTLRAVPVYKLGADDQFHVDAEIKIFDRKNEK